MDEKPPCTRPDTAFSEPAPQGNPRHERLPARRGRRRPTARARPAQVGPSASGTKTGPRCFPPGSPGTSSPGPRPTWRARSCAGPAAAMSPARARCRRESGRSGARAVPRVWPLGWVRNGPGQGGTGAAWGAGCRSAAGGGWAGPRVGQGPAPLGAAEGRGCEGVGRVCGGEERSPPTACPGGFRPPRSTGLGPLPGGDVSVKVKPVQVSFIQPTPSLGVYFLLFMFISVGYNAKC